MIYDSGSVSRRAIFSARETSLWIRIAVFLGYSVGKNAGRCYLRARARIWPWLSLCAEFVRQRKSKIGGGKAGSSALPQAYSQIKSPCSVSLICTGARRDLATCGAHQGSLPRRFGPTRRRAAPTPRVRQGCPTTKHSASPTAQPQTTHTTHSTLNATLFAGIPLTVKTGAGGPCRNLPQSHPEEYS